MEMRLCVRLGLALLLMLPFTLFAQNQQDSLSTTILREDASFWDAYNRCDIEKMSQFFWPDVEFYHDKAGPTIGRSPPGRDIAQKPTREHQLPPAPRSHR